VKNQKLPDRYIFPAIFTYAPDQEISVVFPDIELATSGVDDWDALSSAREALGGRLCLMEEDGTPIPAPSPLSALSTGPNEKAVLVDVFMPSIRLAEVNRSVNRTVTLPAWLNAAALERNVNFSQVLQDALRTQLHLDSR